MSSIRPLATITLLGVAGLLLYWKITETEPVIPDGVGEYEFSANLDSGVESPAAWSDVPGGDSAAAFAGTTPGGEAPAFTAAPGSSAPPWSPPAGGQATVSEAPAFDGGTNAAATTTASEPAMPELPGEESTAAVGAVDAAAAMSATGVAASNAYPAAPSFSTETPDTTANASATGASVPPVETTTENTAGGNSRYGDYSAAPAYDAAANAESVLPTDPAGATAAASGTESAYSQSKSAIQSALDRGELSQALLMLSDWYGDPSLNSAEKQEVDSLLSQLAGSVIYSTEPRLEPEYRVQSGETLEQVAAKYSVTAELLGKINGLAPGQPLAPGQELKVVRGPFSALIDLSERKMTLMLDRRYAGRFDIQVDSSLTVEDGQWEVVDKPLAPASASTYQPAPGGGVDRTVMLQNPAAVSGQVAVLRGPGSPDPVSPEPPGRVIHLGSGDIADVFDILSVGSRVTIRR